MKGYLKSLDGVFQLGPRITTVGREGCDLIIQAVNIDYRHAIIEFNERESTFALQDLESTHGTFVNDVRVRNAAVPLSPGDSVRFGHPGVLFQFIVDFQKEVSICLPLDKRPNYFAKHPVPSQVMYKDGLPQLRSALNPDGYNDGSGEIDPEEQPHWVLGPGQSYEEACEEALASGDESNLELIVQCLRDEVRRLRVFESECMFKDDLLDQLKDEIAYLQVKLRQFEVGCLEITGHEQLNSATSVKMLQLEAETMSPLQRQQQNPTRVFRLPSVIILGPEEPPVPPVESQHSSQPQNSQHSSVAVEEAKAVPPPPSSAISAVPSDQNTTDLQKQLNLAQGFLLQMKQNFETKDATVSKLAKEADDLRQVVADKNLVITTLRESMELSSEETGVEEAMVQSFEETMVKRGREVLVLQMKLKISSKQVAEQTAVIESLKNELESLKKSNIVDRSACRKLQTENDANKTKILDLERQERLARVDVEQLNKSLEKFRSRAIQAVYSQTNGKSPNKKITDDELLLALGKCSALPSVPLDSASKNQLNSPSIEHMTTKSVSNTGSGSRIDRHGKK